MEDNSGFKKEMQKSLETAARTYKAAKELEQAALKMKRMADELFSQVEKAMGEFKTSGREFLDSYNDLKQTEKDLIPPAPKHDAITIKRKNTLAE